MRSTQARIHGRCTPENAPAGIPTWTRPGTLGRPSARQDRGGMPLEPSSGLREGVRGPPGAPVHEALIGSGLDRIRGRSLDFAACRYPDVSLLR